MNYLWEIASSFWRLIDQRDQLLIITLHRIEQSHGLPVSIVEKNLSFLANRYHFVLPQELQDKKIQGKMAILTVDDGHREVYSTLYPIIQSLKIPMVICISTDFFLRNQWLWQDKIRWIFEHPGISQKSQSFSLHENNPVNQASVKQYLKNLSPILRNELIDSLANHCGLDIPATPVEGFRPVKTGEVTTMLESGAVELASHTVTHPILMHLSNDSLEYELQHSKKELEDFSGHRVHSFCYPNGLAGDYDERTTQAVNRAGYSMAFSSKEGINYKGSFDWNELKRIHVHRTPHIFNRSTSGLTDVINQIRFR
jgi:peptidoglycan/xylan/chitin deacetylase (PgdA/CDA1 family)